MDDDEIRALIDHAPAAFTAAAYPLPDDRVLFVARDAEGRTVASFSVPRTAAARLADATLPTALILGADIAAAAAADDADG